MTFATKKLSITEVPGSDLWRLNEPLVYEGRDHIFLVPAGFVTDFASVPRFCQSLIPVAGAHTKSAILHDFFCTGLKDYHYDINPHAPVCSFDADGIFRRTMAESGVKLVRRWLMWAGVRWGAIFSAHRRAGWHRQLWKVLLISILALPIFALLLIVNGTIGLLEALLP